LVRPKGRTFGGGFPDTPRRRPFPLGRLPDRRVLFCGEVHVQQE
jgi:hypothetical protein